MNGIKLLTRTVIVMTGACVFYSIQAQQPHQEISDDEMTIVAGESLQTEHITDTAPVPKETELTEEQMYQQALAREMDENNGMSNATPSGDRTDMSEEEEGEMQGRLDPVLTPKDATYTH